jgi:hypothetical protein
VTKGLGTTVTTATETDKRFHPLFERWARRVRARLATRHALTGAAIGLAIAILPAGVAWKTRHGSLRPFAPAIGVVGACVGLAFARRRRWSDTDVALYLDERLATEEAITTAVELRNESELDDPARAVVVGSAATALADGEAKKARPKLVRPIHLLVPVAAAALVYIARAPIPPAAAAPPPPGGANVQLSNVEGLKRVILLGQASARDEDQKKRLDELAKDADKLKQDLEKGVPKREAQDRIAHLRDQIAAERLSLGAGQERAGMEAAQQKLQQTDMTKDAAKALGDHDLEQLDKDMEKLANEREKSDRELAKKSLQDAADAAKQSGAPNVGKALEDQKNHMESRGNRADLLHELQKGLEGSGLESPDLKQQADSLDKSGSDKDAKKLSDAMGKALEKLTPEERKRLAEKLKEEASKKGVAPGDAQSMKDLADDLASPEGEKELEKRLKDLANQDDESDEAKRQKELDDAQNGAGGTEGDIGKQQPGDPGSDGTPGGGAPGDGPPAGQGGQASGGGQIPIPMPGNGSGNGAPGAGGSSGSGAGGSGGGHDTGAGNHGGSTAPVPNANTLKSRARGPINKAQAMPGTQTGFVAGRAGGTAKTQGTAGIQSAGPSQVDGIDQSDVPQEYRDQVKQYFQP